MPVVPAERRLQAFRRLVVAALDDETATDVEVIHRLRFVVRQRIEVFE